MKDSTFKFSLLSLFICLICSAGLQAQPLITFTPRLDIGCVAGQSVTTTDNFVWRSDATCLTTSLAANSSTLTFAGLLPLGGSTITGRSLDWSEHKLRVPGTNANYYHLEVWPVGTNANNIDGGRSSISLINSRTIELTVGLGRAATACGQIIRGGQDLTITRLNLMLRDATRTSVETSFAYAFHAVPVDAVIEEAMALPSDFDGTEYVSELPAGMVLLKHDLNDLFYFGLASNVVEAQRLRFTKRGGSLTTNDYVHLLPQISLSGNAHQVTLDLNDVDICLPNEADIIISRGTILSLSGVRINYDMATSCLAAVEGGTIVVAEDQRQTLGQAGHGMQLFQYGGELRAAPGAVITLDCGFAVAGSGQINVAEGARVVVTAQTHVQDAYPRSIHVKLAPGASIDFSAAPLVVQELFVVQSVVSAPEAIASQNFRAYPNPASTSTGVTIEGTGALASAIVRIELFDAVGRLVTTEVPSVAGAGSTGFRHVLQLPTAGVYTARLIDADGRVGRVRLVAD